MGKEEECECYNGTIPLPINYKENISACKYCECTLNVGYTCTEIPDCCDISEWEEWTECSCIIDGQVWGPNDIIDDECRYCKCEMGELYCQPKNITQPWSPNCDETCYCASDNGEKVCVNTTKICLEIKIAILDWLKLISNSHGDPFIGLNAEENSPIN